MSRTIRLALFLFVLGVAVIAAWRADQRESYKLAGTAWTCVKPVTVPRTEWLHVGSVAIPTTSSVAECAAWQKR